MPSSNADARIGDAFHVRMFPTETELRSGAAVFDMKAKNRLTDRECADSVEDGQHRA